MDVLNSHNQIYLNLRIKVRQVLKYLLNPLDILSIVLSFQIAYLVHNFENGGLFLSDYDLFGLFIWILPFWIIILSLVKFTGIPIKRTKVLFFLYLQSSVSIFFLLTLCNYFMRLDNIPRMFLAEVSIFAFIIQFFGRVLTYRILRWIAPKNYNHTNAIIVADDSSSLFIENLLSNRKLGFKVVVIFSDSQLIRNQFENNSIILPEKFLGILTDLIKVDFIDEVVYLKEKPDSASVREILRICEDLGITLRLKSEPKANLSSAVKTDIADGKFLSFVNIPNNSYAMVIKKTLDINIALLMIVVLFPVLILLSLLVKLTSKGPVISCVMRSGWRGQMIRVYRFRTKIADEKYTGYESELSLLNDESEPDKDMNFTIPGKFLVTSGLDQLPQLFNVLKGEIPVVSQRHPLQHNIADQV